MTFGTDLKDQIPLIVKYVGDGIESLHQFRSFLKERSNIEREYAQKLEQLSKKYKSQHNTSVKHFLTGADPSQQQQPVKKEDQSTTLQAWNHLLKQTGHIAKIRFRLAEDINDMIVEALRETAVRKEECRRKHAAFYQRLKSERDKTYAEKDRAKQAYDEACLEIENLKAKKARGGDSEKLQRQIDAATLDCYNKKNLYLLAVNIANAERSKYFDEDIPILADQLEASDESRIMSLKSILTHYLNLENSLLTGVQHTHDESLKVVEEINPAVDASIFTRSVGNRVDVQDRAANVTFQFIPWNGGANAAETIIDRVCVDTNLVTNDTASIFLTNKLLKDHRHMEALDSNLSKKATQLQKFESNLDSIQDKYSSEYDTYYEKLLDLKRNITLLTTQRVRVQSEVELIVQSIGDEGLNAAPHDFTITSFTIPTNCDYCKSTLWGLSKGLTCKACGFNCHTKCEMKVVPNCSKKRGQINPQPPQSLALAAGSGNRSRASSTSGSIRSPVPAISSNINIAVDSSNDHLHPSSPLTATANIVTEPAVSSSDATAITTTPTEIQSIYDYLAQNADELNLTAGDILTVVEPDDGSGWIKAQRGAEVGLVPANYIEYITNQLQQNDNDGLTYLTDSLQEGAAVGTDMTEHQLQETVVALYDFEAVNAEELDLHEGDVIIVTKKDDSGWWEGILNGKHGIFPSNYIVPNFACNYFNPISQK